MRAHSLPVPACRVSRQFEHHLAEVVDRAQSTEGSLQRALRSTEDELHRAQADLAAMVAANDTLQAAAESLRAGTKKENQPSPRHAVIR